MRILKWCVPVLCLASGMVTVDARAQAPSTPAASAPSTSEEVISDQPPATLTVWNRTLAVFRKPLGSSTPQQRADAASARIDAALDRLSPREIQYSVVQVGRDRGALIVGGAEALFAILDGDLPQGTATSLDTAGAQAMNRLQTLLRERANQRRWSVLLRSVAEALLAAVAFVAFWFVSRRVLQWLLGRLTAHAAGRIRNTAIEGIDPRPLVFLVLRWLIRLIELAALLAAAYLALTFIFSRFAYSRPWGQTLGQLLWDTITRMAA